MSRWYYSRDGKAEGPVSEEFLIEGLSDGRFKPLDLVFCEGETTWRTMAEVPQFREAAEILPPSGMLCPLTAKDADKAYAWVVLRKKGSSFVQSGPYSQEQVLARIGNGEITYSDYVWRAGYKRWVRIGNLPEFDRRTRDRDGDPVNQIVPLPDENKDAGIPDIPELSSEEVLGSVMRLDRTRVAQTSEPPDVGMVGGVDHMDFDELTGSYHPQPLPGAPQSGVVPPEVAEKSIQRAQSRIAQSESVSTESPDAASGDEATPLAPPPSMQTPATRRSRLALAASVAFLVIVVSLYIFDHAARTDADVPNRQSASVAPASVSQPVRESASVPDAPPAAQAQTPATEAPQAQPQEAPMPMGEDPNMTKNPNGRALESQPGVPTSQQSEQNATPVVEIVPLKLESAPQIVLQTNAPVGSKISLNVSAQGMNGFRRSVDLTRGPGEIPAVDLQSWGLTQGEYVIEATVGSTKVAKTVFIGRREVGERGALERKTLIIVSRRYEDLARSLGEGYRSQRSPTQKWSRFFADWQKQAELAGSSLNSLFKSDAANGFAYPDELQELKGTIDRLYEKSREMNDAVLTAESSKQSRGVASELDTAQLIKDFARIREASTRLK